MRSDLPVFVTDNSRSMQQQRPQQLIYSHHLTPSLPFKYSLQDC
jgi:hypothetical protein